MSVEDWPPDFNSLMIRDARAGISGPAIKRTRALSPNFLLNADSSSAQAFLPPNVVGAATKVISGSFFAAVINCSSVSAAEDDKDADKKYSRDAAGAKARRVFLRSRNSNAILTLQPLRGHLPEASMF